MQEKATTTRSDPEFAVPLDNPAATPGSEHARGETAGCPTGLADLEQAVQIQRAGGGAPRTGEQPSIRPKRRRKGKLHSGFSQRR
jgi:hypothetical protein